MEDLLNVLLSRKRPGDQSHHFAVLIPMHLKGLCFKDRYFEGYKE